jgi:hypothetical protein
MSPFDFINSITYNKKNLIRDGENSDLAEKFYKPYLVNKGLSYFQDTIMFSNEMNKLSHLDNKLQYEFFLNSIRPLKRYAKWIKKVDSDDFEAIQTYFQFNNEKTTQALSLLSSEQINLIKLNYKKVEYEYRKFSGSDASGS